MATKKKAAPKKRRAPVPGAAVEHERSAPTGPKVRAIEMGYYNEERKRPGDVFRLNKPEDFSKRWMEKVGAGEPEKKTGNREALARKTEELNEGKRASSKDDNPLGAD